MCKPTLKERELQKESNRLKKRVYQLENDNDWLIFENRFNKVWAEIDSADDILTLNEVLDYELEDDDTPNGGTCFLGETVRDFIKDLEGFTGEKVETIEQLNKFLIECGIKPIGKWGEVL